MKQSQFAFFNQSVLSFALYTAGLVLALDAMSSATAEDNATADLSQSVPARALGRRTATGDLRIARAYHRATLLPNGQVLVAGGQGINTAEFYNPAERGVENDRQHGHCTLLAHGNIANKWVGTGGRRGERCHWDLRKRGTIRACYWGMDGDRQHVQCTLFTHDDVATVLRSAELYQSAP